MELEPRKAPSHDDSSPEPAITPDSGTLPSISELRKQELIKEMFTCPASDAPRLAFADLMEELKTPQRAEFIRNSIECGHLSETHPEYRGLARICSKVERKRRHSFLPKELDVDDKVTVQVDRGFPQKVIIDPEVISISPKESLTRLLTQPVVTDIEFSSIPTASQLSTVLQLAPNITRVGIFGGTDATPLHEAFSGEASAVRELSIMWPHDTPPELLDSISQFAPNLEVLKLYWNTLPRGIFAELKAGSFDKLRCLALTHTKLDCHGELQFLPHVAPYLQGLALSSLSLSDSSFGSMYEPSTLKQLTTINLSSIRELSKGLFLNLGVKAPNLQVIVLDTRELPEKTFLDLVGSNLFNNVCTVYIAQKMRISEIDRLAIGGAFPAASIIPV